MTHKQNNIISILIIILGALLLAVHPFFTFRYTDSRTNCLPYKLWLIDKTDKYPDIGEYIVFRTPAGIKNIPSHKTWVKIVYATGEGHISVVPAKPGEKKTVEINGMKRDLPIGAYVSVVAGKRHETFTAFAADSAGRSLPIVVSQNITPGHYYTYAPETRSYDSRYWGLVKQNEVLGKAYPIF